MFLQLKNQLIITKLIDVFSSLNQCYDIIVCAYSFELFSQVNDVAHVPLGFCLFVCLFFFCFREGLFRTRVLSEKR